MRELREIVHHGGPAITTLTLDFDRRQKSRQRVRLDDGSEASLMLPRGTVLRDGDCLRADDGTSVLVRAAPELLSQVETSEALALTRAAYHLGNRHVPLQIGPGWLRYQHDHVLDDMVRALGLAVSSITAGFQPEAGAYGGAAPQPHGYEHHHHHD